MPKKEFPPCLTSRPISSRATTSSWRRTRSPSTNAHITAGGCGSSWTSAPSTNDCRESVRTFRRKLEEKGQAEWMRTQAIDAVRLYFFLDNPGDKRPPGTRSDARAPDPRPATQRAPQPATQEMRASAPGGSNPGERHPGRAAARRLGGRHDSATAVATQTRKGPPGQAPHSVVTQSPRLPAAPQPAVANAATAPTAGPAPNGWPEMYDRLDPAIKVRHYSG